VRLGGIVRRKGSNDTQYSLRFTWT